MKPRHVLTIKLALLLGMLAMIHGCSPMQEALTIRTTATGTGIALNVSRENHLIDDSTWVKINASEHNLTPLLDDLTAAAVKAEANKLNISATLDYNSIKDAVLAELKTLTAAKAAKGK